jgi:HEPN domain-containing protein
MPPEHLPPDDPREWLNRAKSSLAQANNRLPQVYLEDLCFDAQQAAEKALKALLVARGCRFPFVHDLGDLLRRLEEAGERIPDQVRESATLTDYAVEARYPGPGEPVAEAEYTRAVALAEAVVAWVERQIASQER